MFPDLKIWSKNIFPIVEIRKNEILCKMLTRRNFASNFVQIAYITSAIEGEKVVIQVYLSVSNNNLNLICYGFVQKIVVK